MDKLNNNWAAFNASHISYEIKRYFIGKNVSENSDLFSRESPLSALHSRLIKCSSNCYLSRYQYPGQA